MKTLSIQQPWAWAIIHAGKNVENRSWWINFRGTILVHTGKILDELGVECIKTFYPEVKLPGSFMLGGIIGSVKIVDCVAESKSKWFRGRFGLVLENPIALPFMPCRGQLGFFDVTYKDAREDGEGTGSTSSNTQKL